MEVITKATETTTLYLTKDQGEKLRQLIERATKQSFNRYCEEVGLTPQNMYPILSGKKKISIKVLKRLLSNVDFELECTTSFAIKKKAGEPAQDAHSLSLEEELYLEEMEQLGVEVEQPQSIEKEDQSTTEEYQQPRPNQEFTPDSIIEEYPSS